MKVDGVVRFLIAVAAVSGCNPGALGDPTGAAGAAGIAGPAAAVREPAAAVREPAAAARAWPAAGAWPAARVSTAIPFRRERATISPATATSTSCS